MHPAAFGIRVVVAVSGGPADTPLDVPSRARYCAFAASLLRRYPTLDDVVVWTEPNSSRFWSGGPAAYEALLAQCWDALHATRPQVNVIAARRLVATITRPAEPAARPCLVPGTRRRRSARADATSPILDTVGHNVYPSRSAEAPGHVNTGGSLDEGDYAKLIAVLPPPSPAPHSPSRARGLTIWYMEDGFQTAGRPRPGPLYVGRENDRWALDAFPGTPGADKHLTDDQARSSQPPSASRTASPPSARSSTSSWPTSAYLGGWQSGLLWANWQPKPSYAAFKQAVWDVDRGAVAAPASTVDAVAERHILAAGGGWLIRSGARSTS